MLVGTTEWTMTNFAYQLEKTPTILPLVIKYNGSGLHTHEGNYEGDFVEGDFIVSRRNLVLLWDDFCFIQKRIATAHINGGEAGIIKRQQAQVTCIWI